MARDRRGRAEQADAQARRIELAALAHRDRADAARRQSIACLAVCHDPGGWAYVGTGIAMTTMIVPLSTAF